MLVFGSHEGLFVQGAPGATPRVRLVREPAAAKDLAALAIDVALALTLLPLPWVMAITPMKWFHPA